MTAWRHTDAYTNVVTAMREHLEAMDASTAQPMPFTYWAGVAGVTATTLVDGMEDHDYEFLDEYRAAIKARYEATMADLRALPENLREPLRVKAYKRIAAVRGMPPARVRKIHIDMCPAVRKRKCGRESQWGPAKLRKLKEAIKQWPAGAACGDVARYMGVPPQTMLDAVMRGEFDSFTTRNREMRAYPAPSGRVTMAIVLRLKD